MRPHRPGSQSDSPLPVVRLLVVCEDIRVTDPTRPRRVSLDGLIHAIYPSGQPRYPCRRPVLCVFAQLTECRRLGIARIEIREADTDTVVFRTPTHRLPLGNDPLAVHGLRFRLLGCTFPAPGLYWVQLWYDNSLLAQQSLALR